MKSDVEIQDAVIRELRADGRVRATDIGVAVANRVVTLTGTVSRHSERIAAEEAAHRVRGVLDVVDNIRVEAPGSPTRSDIEIAHAVRHALQWTPDVPDQRIRSTVSDGWVTLEGDVDRWEQREEAEGAVRGVAGVRGVTNLIVVRELKGDPAGSGA